MFFGLSTDPSVLPGVAVPVVALGIVTMVTKAAVAWFGGDRRGIGTRGRWRATALLGARGEFSIIIASLGVTAGGTARLSAIAAGYVLLTATAGPVLARGSIAGRASRFDGPSHEPRDGRLALPFNGLRLARTLAKRDGVAVRVFLMGDAVVSALAGQQLPDGYYHLDRMVSSVLRRGEQVTQRGQQGLGTVGGRSRDPDSDQERTDGGGHVDQLGNATAREFGASDTIDITEVDNAGKGPGSEWDARAILPGRQGVPGTTWCHPAKSLQQHAPVEQVVRATMSALPRPRVGRMHSPPRRRGDVSQR